MVKKHYRFYIDESETSLPRVDGMNCFCYAGVLIAEEDIEPIRTNYKAFCEKWGITYPLHNVHIRGKRNNFDWLKHETGNRKAEDFLEDYHQFMADQPYKILGCVVDKEIYMQQHQFVDKNYNEEIKKLAFQVVLQKLVILLLPDRNVTIYIEEAGKKQDNFLRNIIVSFKKEGLTLIDEKITSIAPPVFFENITGDLTGVKKDNIFTQIADFCAFPISKALYDKNYRPFELLLSKNKFNKIDGDRYDTILYL